MGRHKLKAKETRSVRLKVNATPEQAKFIKAIAKSKGKSVSKHLLDNGMRK